ncbi:MAG: hydantoinase/oxoprolinase family protein [Planctomycetota bacterium]
MLTVGIDTGGTFTDFVAGDSVLKVRSTPDDPTRAICEGLARLGIDEARRIVHGTTVATNALLTGDTARTAFVTTAGLEDLLEVGRQDRAELYAISPRAHDPLVAPADRFGVRERLRPDGSVETPLHVDDLAARLIASGVQAVAVCLLHAYRNPAHERELAEALSETGLPVSLSHEVANEFREFERAATTTANAALMPVMAPYLTRLADALAQHDVEILQSNGGTAPPAEIARLPVRTVLSGPAGGVIAATDLARRHEITDAVSFDMGGTSTDVALLRNNAQGDPEVMPEFRIGGLPLRVPVLDVHTVGAGGGSLVHTDALGALRVGPQSAGADPGPACYGKGDRATVTDAHAVLGHLTAADALAGTLSLDVDRARRALADPSLGSASPEQNAADVLLVANAVMEAAIRKVTVMRGVDPRPCTLIAFGGAGGLHACALADAIAMRDVLIPVAPGTFSARGMVDAERRRDFVRTVLLPAADCVARLPELLEPLRGENGAGETANPAQRLSAVERVWADVRYVGQSHELRVAADADLVRSFHDAHLAAYGYHDEARPVEVVNLRLTISEPVPREAPWPKTPPSEPRSAPARMQRSELEGSVSGPTVIVEETATTVVPDGWRATCLAGGALLLERNE